MSFISKQYLHFKKFGDLHETNVFLKVEVKGSFRLGEE